MDLVLVYSIFVGLVFMVWLLFVIRQFHKLRNKNK
ncbi:hypothetical protein RB2501_10247 [Robiginitalea biformata HTCC2501]|uniref:Uncharacterized protein n=1 Tax=Robiginitalea biformata (strain ATCC BAA-864 / DSM 15991 / KCTC 12146 / HTCC2501) TaxID=313596 RepID=A4CM06_ROBBH|nr:hypothetical protein RB2501_10247 [Robiginitalea biformata HTCC2501]